MNYRCEATSVAGFVKQLAVSYISNGYYRYVTGEISKRKDPRAVDKRIIEKYGLEVGKTSRSRRKALGLANVQYLRHRRFFVIIATDGQHELFEREPEIFDVRLERPIKAFGYSISYRGGHVHVRIQQHLYLNLKARWADLAVHRRKEWFEARFARLPYEPYAPVRSQARIIWREVNRRRALAGYDLVGASCLSVLHDYRSPFAENAVKTHVTETVDSSRGSTLSVPFTGCVAVSENGLRTRVVPSTFPTMPPYVISVPSYDGLVALSERTFFARQGHPHVRIEQRRFLDLKACL